MQNNTHETMFVKTHPLLLSFYLFIFDDDDTADVLFSSMVGKTCTHESDADNKA